MDAQGAVGHPDDKGQYIDDYSSRAGSGWNKLFGFFDGVRGVTDRVEAIAGDVAGTQMAITEGKRAKFELRRDKQQFEQDQFLEKVTTQRGDNRVWIYAIGGVAALGVVMLVSK